MKKYGKPGLRVNPRTIAKLIKYPWPGNVRELQHLVERAVILNDKKVLSIGNILPDSSSGTSIQAKEILKLDEMEKQHIIKIINKNRGNITRASENLGISRTALHRRIRKYDI